MITITAVVLGLYTILVGSLFSFIAFMVGYQIGKSNESEEVYQYYQSNQMSLTEELIKDRYTVNTTDKPIFKKSNKV
jgi:hypothetical protein